MKMKPEHFAALSTAIHATLAARDIPVFRMNSNNVWDIFHMAWGDGRINGNALYRDYNDDHIDTALRRIVHYWAKHRSAAR